MHFSNIAVYIVNVRLLNAHFWIRMISEILHEPGSVVVRDGVKERSQTRFLKLESQKKKKSRISGCYTLHILNEKCSKKETTSLLSRCRSAVRKVRGLHFGKEEKEQVKNFHSRTLK